MKSPWATPGVDDRDRIHPRSPSGWEDGLEPWRDGNEDGSNRDVPPFDNDPRTDEEIKQAVYDRADDEWEDS
jgi:hypothetical protein